MTSKALKQLSWSHPLIVPMLSYIQSILLQNIPKELPILLICSKEDTVVPWQNTIKLYQKLRATGHKNAYLFVLEHGKHGMLIDPCYNRVVNAFAKQFELSADVRIPEEKNYIAILKAQSEANLNKIQPLERKKAKPDTYQPHTNHDDPKKAKKELERVAVGALGLLFVTRRINRLNSFQ